MLNVKISNWLMNFVKVDYEKPDIVRCKRNDIIYTIIDKVFHCDVESEAILPDGTVIKLQHYDL